MPNEKADLFSVEGEHKGLLIAAWLDPDLASRLAVPGGEPPDQLHVTLCYCPDADQMSDVAIARAIDRVAWVAEGTAPLTGQIAGIGRFNASESSDNKDVFYANVDVPGLERLRQLIVDMLDGTGCQPSTAHGYTPHITLAYIDPNTPMPLQRLGTQPLVIKSLWVSVGDRRTEIPLTNGYPIKAVPEKYAVKALGGNRVGGYMVLWGDSTRKDLTGEWFTPETQELTTIFKAMGRLPFLYNHATDATLKTEVVGTIDVMQADEIGLWYEAQLNSSNRYKDAIQNLARKQVLGTSSGTLPGAREVARSGEILRWPIVEGSATIQPAESRMLEHPIAEIKANFASIGLAFEQNEDSDTYLQEIKARLGLLDLLEIELGGI